MIVVLLSLVTFINVPVSFFSAAYAETSPAKEIYSCPMHPHVKSHEPGNCPICHMKLQKITVARADQPEPKKIKFYRNPMNPSITSKVPAKDNMGMDYIPVYETTEVSSEGSSRVPLRGDVTIDQTQFSLAGAALSKVERRDLTVEVPVAGRALDSSRVVLQVREREIGLLRTGLEVSLTSPALLGEEVLGKITSLDSALDPMTRTLRVDVSLFRPYPALKAEASVQGVVRRTLAGVLAIPRESIMPGPNGDTYVYVVDRSAGKLIPRKIVLGAKGRDLIEVTSGLSSGEQIASGPNFLIDSESRIRAVHD